MERAERTTAQTAVPTAQDRTTAKVRELSQWLRGESGRIEASGRIPDDVAERLRDAGLFRLTLPRRLGGENMTPAQVWPLVYEVARGNGSAAWLVSLCLANTIMLARLPDTLQQELFANGPHIVMSALTGAAPRGLKVEHEADGVRISGTWGYASGVEIAHWVGLVAPTGPRGEVSFVFVPRSEFAIDPASWNVLGMRGTGSKDVSLDRVFVPVRHLMDWKTLQDGGAQPGCSHIDDMHDYPLNALFAMSILAPTLGLTRALVDEFGELAGRRLQRQPDVRDPFTTTELASAEASIALACDSLVAEAARPVVENWTRESTTALRRAQMRVRISTIARSARAAAQNLLAASGGQVMPVGTRLESLLRDLHAMNSHLLLQPQPVSENYGRLMLGLDILPGSRI